MCVEIRIGENYCETVKDLRRAVSKTIIIPDKHYVDLAEDGCLCQVDIPKTAEANGYNCFDVDSMCYDFVKIND
jgi:hypothetical protein